MFDQICNGPAKFAPSLTRPVQFATVQNFVGNDRCRAGFDRCHASSDHQIRSAFDHCPACALGRLLVLSAISKEGPPEKKWTQARGTKPSKLCGALLLSKYMWGQQHLSASLFPGLDLFVAESGVCAASGVLVIAPQGTAEGRAGTRAHRPTRRSSRGRQTPGAPATTLSRLEQC